MTEDKNSEGFRPFRSATRLVVGGLLLGSQALTDRLRAWDAQQEQGLPTIVDAETQVPLEFEPLPDHLPPPGLTDDFQANGSDVRYALLGLLFESEEQLERVFRLGQRVGAVTSRVINPFIRPFTRIPNPAQKRLDHLAARGQTQVDRWISRGREEEYLSRQLVQDAAANTMDESLTYMAQNPALEELIQTQSVGFAEQIVEEIRKRAVSVDYFFEGVARYIFRRKPRYLLDPPDPEVINQAAWHYQDYHPQDLE